ncbi:MAG: 3-oxoacyl-ACP reductase [Rhizobiales bacterium PAR1]|nr:MAG: 3-oxoacyl-ACP reductase [Rhizobiales bacterium PAR1]
MITAWEEKVGDLLAGQLALVTGAGQGNGAAIARGLARHGSGVIVTDINADTVAETAKSIRDAGGKAWSFVLDVADPAACEALASRVEKEIGQVSILINNAGICPRHTIDDPNLRAAWDSVMSVNVDGTLNTALAFVAQLRATKGAIVNTASIAAYVSTATSVGYSASKAAVRLLTQNLAQELAKDGVRVNAIAPGPFITAMTAPTRENPERSASFLSRIPMGRYGEPDELVGPILFLVSPMASYITGTTLAIDGGYLAV